MAESGKKSPNYVLQRLQDVDHQRRRRRHPGGRQTDINAGPKGITAFIIEKGMKGFSTAPTSTSWACAAQHLPLFFDDVEVPGRTSWGR